MSKKQNIYKPSLNFGLILGGFGILLTTSMYFGGAVFFANIKYTVLAFFFALIVYIVFGVKTAKEARAINGGSISFSKLLMPIFVTFFIGTIISNVFSIILFQFIDPDFNNQVKEFVILQIESYEGILGTEEIEKLLDNVESASQKGIRDQLGGVVFGLLLYFAISIIIAASVKKNKKVV